MHQDPIIFHLHRSVLSEVSVEYLLVKVVLYHFHIINLLENMKNKFSTAAEGKTMRPNGDRTGGRML